MKKPEYLSFVDLAESEQFDDFIRSFWDLTHVPIAIVDPELQESKYFCPVDKMNAICRVIRSSECGRDACMRTDKLRCNQAAVEKQGIRYFCHAGLVDFAAPIYVHSRHVATIMCGQILSREPDDERFEEFYSKVREFKLDKDELREAYFRTPYMSTRQLEALLKLITFFAEYVCELGIRLKYSGRCRHPEIELARNYLKQNFREQISLERLAYEVGFSSAYLSRLFKKVENQSFTSYLQNLRLSEAKKLLSESDMRIIDIAMNSGFENVCYFNELFKKVENCTPSEYRRRNGAE